MWPMTQAIPAETVRRALEEVLARGEFSREKPWLQRLFDRIFDGVDLPGFGAPAGIAFAAVLGLAALVLLFFVVRRLARDVRAQGGAAQQAPDRAQTDDVRARVAQLLREARAARERGDLTLALRLCFFALVVGLGRRGALEYRAAWTLRELLARGQPAPEVAAMLTPLTVELEGKSFGREPTRLADVERLEELCARFRIEG